LAFDDLATADSYTYTHSVRVTTLGLVLGQHSYQREGWIDWGSTHRRDRIAERMTHLGLGLLSHDIGKLAILAQILTKAEKLTAQEWELSAPIRRPASPSYEQTPVAAECLHRARSPRTLGRPRVSGGRTGSDTVRAHRCGG
jgi:hypothetical protein